MTSAIEQELESYQRARTDYRRAQYRKHLADLLERGRLREARELCDYYVGSCEARLAAAEEFGKDPRFNTMPEEEFLARLKEIEDSSLAPTH